MRKIVVLSLDAMFDRDLQYYHQDSWMGAWLKKAVLCAQVKTVFPALTYPAHTTLITGCDPHEHGVGQNQPFQPDQEASMRTWYWDAAEVKRETLLQAVKRQGGRCASILWPVTGKNPAVKWNFPEVLALPGENQTLKMLQYGSWPWILHMECKHGRERVSIREPYLSDYAVILARDVIRAHQPDLTLAHLVDVDEMRHHHGVDSQEARQGIQRMEGRVKAVWETMQSTPGMEDALLVLVSDHGQADVSRTVNLTEAMKTAGLGDCAQVQSNGMSAYLFAYRQGERGIERAAQWLLEKGQDVGVKRLYARDDLNRMGCVDGPALAVEAAENVVFSDGLPQAKREKATHGFGPEHPAENCLLAVRGRCVREGVKLPAMPMRDVAPTLAGLMGISLPQAQGEDHSGLIMRERKSK